MDVLDIHNQTPLIVAIMNGQLAVVKYLLELGANVNLPDIIRNGPIHYAAENGNIEIMKLLLQHPDIYLFAYNSEDKNALHIASAFGHTAIVKLLKPLLAVDINQRDHFGKTALYLRLNICISYLLLTLLIVTHSFMCWGLCYNASSYAFSSSPFCAFAK